MRLVETACYLDICKVFQYDKKSVETTITTHGDHAGSRFGHRGGERVIQNQITAADDDLSPVPESGTGRK